MIDSRPNWKSHLISTTGRFHVQTASNFVQMNRRPRVNYWCYVRAVVLLKILKVFQYVHCNIARETAISSFVWAKTR